MCLDDVKIYGKRPKGLFDGIIKIKEIKIIKFN
jgi:hypothetical protein